GSSGRSSTPRRPGPERNAATRTARRPSPDTATTRKNSRHVAGGGFAIGATNGYLPQYAGELCKSDGRTAGDVRRVSRWESETGSQTGSIVGLQTERPVEVQPTWTSLAVSRAASHLDFAIAQVLRRLGGLRRHGRMRTIAWRVGQHLARLGAFLAHRNPSAIGRQFDVRPIAHPALQGRAAPFRLFLDRRSEIVDRVSPLRRRLQVRSEEHTSELQSL